MGSRERCMPVFIGNGGLKTSNDQINFNERRLADQALALAQGELSLAKTEKKLLESELLLHQKRTAQLTAAMEGDMKAATLTIVKL